MKAEGGTICSACGRPAGVYLTPFGTGPMHVDGSDAAACADARGDQDWHIVKAGGGR